MSRKSLKYSEGDLFLVPLMGTGFALGLVVRMDKSSTIFGHFFGPRLSSIPNDTLAHAISSSVPVLRAKVGHLGLQSGEWPMLGRLPNWNIDNWPFPDFIAKDVFTGKYMRRTYDERDVNSWIATHPADTDDVNNLPEDRLYGAKALEIKLNTLLK